MRTAPRGDVVEARQQVEDRGLAGAGGADERDRFAGLDGEAHAVERRRVAIGEGDVVELDAAVRDGERLCAGAVDDGGRLVEQAEDARERGERLRSARC